MGLRVEERIVACGEGDDLLVHHLVLHGSTRAIARHLCEVERARYGCAAPPAAPPFPAPGERLRGSAAFVPARLAPGGHPLVERTFEHERPLGRPRAGAAPAGRPYVIELHPDEGHASLAVCAFELDGAALDGVNAEGLVAVAALDPGTPPAAGLDALQAVRHLLDRCASAAAARDALLGGEAGEGRGRWLVADHRGDAFLVERAPGGSRCVDAGGARLEAGAPRDDAPLVTLWHGGYDAEERRLAARFHVGGWDERRGEAPEIQFQLA